MCDSPIDGPVDGLCHHFHWAWTCSDYLHGVSSSLLASELPVYTFEVWNVIIHGRDIRYNNNKQYEIRILLLTIALSPILIETWERSISFSVVLIIILSWLIDESSSIRFDSIHSIRFIRFDSFDSIRFDSIHSIRYYYRSSPVIG